MTNVTIDAGRGESGGFKVDVGRGQRIGRVSSEWFNRPDDERYLSLSDLMAAVRGRAEQSRTRMVESAAIRVEASRDDAERLTLALPGAERPMAPTHWSFGQLASLVGAPATYLRQLPAPLAGINLQYGLTSHRAEQVKTLEVDDGRVYDRASHDAALAIALALREAVARDIGVDAEEMGFAAPEAAHPALGRSRSAVVFDRASGGAGFSTRIARDPIEYLKRARALLDCSRAGRCQNPDAVQACPVASCRSTVSTP